MNMAESIQSARLGDVERTADGGAVLLFRFDAAQPVFAGHFPGHPILPGVFQLEMARLAAELVLGVALTVRVITKAKFRRPILPAETIRLELKLTESAGTTQARAVFTVEGQPAGETILQLTRST
jgi:3-hydroxyacyl-[acyl-carrier-protein] dehydratase